MTSKAYNKLNWYQQHRMDWILETVDIFGFINRKHLQRKFGISDAQATNDLSSFQACFPCHITYDMSCKTFRSTNRDGVDHE